MHNLTDEQLIEELRFRMAQKTNALEELKILNKKLEESEKLKSHFISNITNEIVNPFSSILGLSRSILSVDKENWKKALSMVAMIHTEAFSLDFQLKNIFAAAKIEAGEISPEIGNVNIQNLVKSVIESFRIEARKKKISFILNFNLNAEDTKTLYFKSDPEKLKLILSNLINNAVNFSIGGSSISVDVWLVKRELNISVLNNGIEISADSQQLIFDRFKRVDSGITSVNRGHGLGLSIIKALIDLLGGNIEFKSDKLTGTRFTISLPEAEEYDNAFTTTLNGNDLFFEDSQIF
jgi:signal transduction histidine kinase